jgi:multidrug efflux pump subunit AcrA (membrane-fusion protein)
VLVVREEGDGLVAQRQPTELGAQSGGFVVVTSGVEPGDRVIASGQSTVSEGDRVRIAEELPSGFAPVSLAD